MRDYDWSQKSLSDKIAEQFLVMLGFICFGYFGLTIAAHRLITWSDLNWDFAWGIIKCLLILALFPIIIVPAIWVFQKGHSSYEPQNTFYREWASVYVSSSGKWDGAWLRFSVEDVEGFKIERAVYREQPIYLLTIRFRKRFGNSNENERCGLRLKNESELQSLLDWASTNHIAVEGPLM